MHTHPCSSRRLHDAELELLKIMTPAAANATAGMLAS